MRLSTDASGHTRETALQRGSPAARRRWAVIALIAAGWFVHDATLHAALATLGVNRLVGFELGLPDLGALGIDPDRTLQIGALVFASVAAIGLFLLGRLLLSPAEPVENSRLKRRSR